LVRSLRVNASTITTYGDQGEDMSPQSKLIAVIAIVGTVAHVSAALGAACTSNAWQPTFVHNEGEIHEYYVGPGGAEFTPMDSQESAQATCRARGVRNTINGQTCDQRFWGDFACSCGDTPTGNSTCDAFNAFQNR
jgi:hypothetical protein